LDEGATQLLVLRGDENAVAMPRRQMGGGTARGWLNRAAGKRRELKPNLPLGTIFILSHKLNG